MTGKRFLNLSEVVSQDRAEQLLLPHEDDFREPFFVGWSAWVQLAAFDPTYHAKATPRGRASLIFDHIMDDAKSRFEDRRSEGIRTCDKYDSYLVAIGEEIVVRFKMFDNRRRPRNYPTERQIRIASQQAEFPNMPRAATILSVGYRLNPAATELMDIYISCRQMVTEKWAYPLWEADASNQLFGQAGDPSAPNAPSAADQVDMPKPIIRPKFGKRKAEGE